MITTYTTSQGDMWDGIAYTQMGSCDYTGDLMQANMSHIHTFIFPAGVQLTIPDPPESTSADSPPWKQVDG